MKPDAAPTGSAHPAATAATATGGAPTRVVLCLYLAGSSASSARAIVNTREFCERHLPGRYDLEVVDVSLHPERVAAAQIVALPTLVRTRPEPVRRFIGDMSQTDRLLRGLGPAAGEPAAALPATP